MTAGDIKNFLQDYLLWILKLGGWVLDKLKEWKLSKNKKRERAIRRKRAVFQDSLTGDITKWTPINGQPQISQIRGKPPYIRSLLLEETQESRRYSFVGANYNKIQDGEVECDVYLEREALFNLVIRADDQYNIYYMVRLDSRRGQFNGILFDPGNRNWDFIKQSNINTASDRWWHMRVRFKGSEIKLYLDGKLVIATSDKRLPGLGNVGIFNELKRVFVNNFVIRKF